MVPALYIVVPCYNEEAVLPITSTLFLDKIKELESLNLVSSDSKILFVNDGSTDNTWNIICDLAKKDSHYTGISQSRNRGHQSTLLAGLMEAKDDVLYRTECVSATMSFTFCSENRQLEDGTFVYGEDEALECAEFN